MAQGGDSQVYHLVDGSLGVFRVAKFYLQLK